MSSFTRIAVDAEVYHCQPVVCNARRWQMMTRRPITPSSLFSTTSVGNRRHSLSTRFCSCCRCCCCSGVNTIMHAGIRRQQLCPSAPVTRTYPRQTPGTQTERFAMLSRYTPPLRNTFTLGCYVILPPLFLCHMAHYVKR